MKDNQNFRNNRHGKNGEAVKNGRYGAGKPGGAKQNGSRRTMPDRYTERPSEGRDLSVDSTLAAEEESGLVVGRNAVRELLKSGRAIDKLLVQRGEREGSIVVLVAEAIERGIPVIETEKPKLDELVLFNCALTADEVAKLGEYYGR